MFCAFQFRNRLCLLITAYCTCVSLNTICFVSSFLGDLSFIESMLCIAVFLCVVYCRAPVVQALMPVASRIAGPGSCRFMLMLCRIIICIVEYDHIVIFQILLNYTEVRMNAIQSVHPATELTVCKLCKLFIRSLRSDSLNIVSSCVSPGVFILCQNLAEYIINCCVCIYFISFCFDPGIQVSCMKCMIGVILITVMDTVSKQ